MFNVAAKLNYGATPKEWSFSTELDGEWVISKNFKITGGQINVDHNYDAGLSLDLEVKLGKGKNQENSTFAVALSKTGSFYNISGRANDFPKVTSFHLKTKTIIT